ncbi:hypothetical protein [Lactiplantibacillus songbeiensis]|uniref:Integral membrane protein n=1 Tax=Lactiplantibacillus songbeiensis TaxID=2559920 RepID=A0ABW4BZ88_9LACO
MNIHLSKLEIRDYLIGFALVLTMVGIATWQHDYEIILPEIGALTTGTWIYHKNDWVNQPFKIFLAPFGTAVLGFLVNQLAIGYPEKVLLTLIAMLIWLRIVGSALAPSFATGLLPVIVNATHWSFIVAIFAFTVILMLGVYIRGLQHGCKPGEPLHYQSMLIFMVVAAAWVGGVWLVGRPQMAAIPPVLVVFFEVLQKPTYSGKLMFKQIIALSLAATIGVLIHIGLASWLLTTLISLPLVFILLQLLDIKLPAAYAFPLLALVLPANMFSHLPVTAVLAASFFLGLVYGYKKLATVIKFALAND